MRHSEHGENPDNIEDASLSYAGDWRTLVLIFACHGLIIALSFNAMEIHPLIVGMLLVPLLTLYSSLQHEVIHGHPFKTQWLNDLLVLAPYSIFVPYYRFRDTHLAHRFDVNLCDPFEDPESWYQPPDEWSERSRVTQTMFNFNNTLIGRMIIGPAIGSFGLFKCDTKSMLEGDWRIGAKWFFHILCVASWLALIMLVGGLPIWTLLIAAYLGMSLLMVRTFLEHQAHDKVRGRSVIIEDGGFFAFLFLNNSLHAVHHAHPRKPWYQLPAIFAANREKYLAMNLEYSFRNYRDIFRRFSFRRKEPVPFPTKTDLKKP